MCIDSGSNKNIIGDKTWTFLQNMNAKFVNFREGSDIIFKSYGNHEPLNVVGSFTANIDVHKSNSNETIYIIKGGQTSLIGKETAIKLGILKIGFNIFNVTNEVNIKKLPYIKGIQIDIPIDRSVQPVSQSYRRIPIPLEDAVDGKINELLENDVIEPVSDHTGWVSPMVVINKSNKDIRICVDMRKANKAVLREKHPMPTVEDLLSKLKNAQLFSCLDIKQAFHQIMIKPESRDITTFVTGRGLFRYKRLMFGISCAPEIFQRTIERILSGCEGFFVYIDDILIFGENESQHDARLKAVRERLSSYNVLLNDAKCKIRTTEIEFLGHHISVNGVRPTTSKIEAVQNFRQPETVEEVRSFLGLINYVSRFIPDVATKTSPLRELIKTNKFVWNEEQREAFKILKEALTSDSVLGFYSAQDDIQVIADASPVGLGAVLCQIGIDGPRIIAFGHRSLSEREQKYHITEKEAMALVWAVEHFHRYLCGKKFDLITDHKPLEFMFNPKSNPCARVERWVLRLQAYDFNVVYKPGKLNIADPLSRLPMPKACQNELFDEHTECFIKAIANELSNVAPSIKEINEMSMKDCDITLIRKCLDDDKIWEKESALHLYKPFKMEFCFHENILLRGTKIVPPIKLRQKFLQLGHEGHPGVENMKRLLRKNVWWPKIDTDIKEFVRKCHACNLVTSVNIPEPMKMRTFPTAPWIDIAIDFCGPLPSGHYLLVVIDYYSRFKEVIVTERITSKETIEHLRKLFSLLGLPKSITADNGKQLISREFKSFCTENGVKLYSTPPYWPQANGLVERQNRSLLKRLKISANTPNREWRKDLYTYLLMDRNTPHPATGVSPAELLFGRPTRTKIPSITEGMSKHIDDEEVRDHDLIFKTKTKEYADEKRKAKPSTIGIGDTVLVQKERTNKLSAPYKDEKYIVRSKFNGDVTLQSTVSDEIIRRNVAHLKLCEAQSSNIHMEKTTGVSDDDDSDISEIPNTSHDNQHTINARPPLPKLKINLHPIPTCTAIYQDKS